MEGFSGFLCASVRLQESMNIRKSGGFKILSISRVRLCEASAFGNSGGKWWTWGGGGGQWNFPRFPPENRSGELKGSGECLQDKVESSKDFFFVYLFVFLPLQHWDCNQSCFVSPGNKKVWFPLQIFVFPLTPPSRYPWFGTQPSVSWFLHAGKRQHMER